MSFLAAMKTIAPEVKVEEAAKVGGATVTKAVIDTNAIVKGFRLERFAEEAVTIPEVLTEVKDKQARHTLATLPFELKVLEPDVEAMSAVRRFARLTGDLPALSEPDIKQGLTLGWFLFSGVLDSSSLTYLNSSVFEL